MRIVVRHRTWLGWRPIIVRALGRWTRQAALRAVKRLGGGHENCPLTAMRSARHDSVCLAASRLRPTDRTVRLLSVADPGGLEVSVAMRKSPLVARRKSPLVAK
jgi:hypothetical protein